MEADLIVVGNTYQCASPLLEECFRGKVEKLYDLSALVEVSDSSQIDTDRVQELNKRLVIPFSQIVEV
ncbi:DUF2187 domain-containing protein [uncultured Vagococcus sp.]|uniref:DUF2187 domain-containing protein n=1 Tax=uncultured Vagococcus sp. TaxID=189676 RepID=UPI0028D5349D|nr:DUF2187 domain-containing protein [uncultured Vagococcus sp.]